jgi:hypothetical protein
LPGKITISPAIAAPSYSQINSSPVRFLPYSRVGNDEYFEYPGFPKLKLRDSFAWNCSLLVQNGFDYEEYKCTDEKRRYINRLCNSAGDGVEMNIGENREVSAIIFAHKCETYSESLERMVNGVRFLNGIYGPSTLNTVNHPSWLLSPEIEVALDNFLIDGCWVFLVGLKLTAP